MGSVETGARSVDIEDVRAARRRIAGHIHRTPVIHSCLLDELSGCEVFFKCENLQKVGAFKARGALNAVLGLDEDQAARCVATHSSGNHGAALAMAAGVRGIPAWVVMPENAPPVKKAAVIAYGAEVIECEPTLKARESTLEQVVSEHGAHVVHPYDDPRIIAGQGTTALELLEQLDGCSAVVIPVGGGGLPPNRRVLMTHFAPSGWVTWSPRKIRIPSPTACSPASAYSTTRSSASAWIPC